MIMMAWSPSRKSIGVGVNNNEFYQERKKSINEYERGEFNPENLKTPEESRGQEVQYLIVVSHGRKDMHDSGHPFIKIIGRTKEGFLNLGWHDHFLSYVSTNVDSLGKNVFRIMPWDARDKPWTVSDGFLSSSTFQIGCPDYYSDYDPKRTILR